MTALRNLSILMLLPALLISCAAPKPAKLENPAESIPLRDFFKNPEIATYRISPDGTHLAYLKPWKSRLNVFVKDLKTKKERQLTRQESRDIRSFFWKGDGYILYSRDFGGDENFHVFSVNVKTGKGKDVTPYKGVKVSVVDDLEDIDNDNVIISMNKRDRKLFDVYRLNIKTGKTKLVVKNPGNFTSYVTDHNGKVRVAISTDGVNSTVFYRENEKANFEPSVTTSFRETLYPLFFTFDNQRVFATSNLGRDRSAIVEYDLKNKKEMKVLFEHPVVDVETLTYSKLRKELIATIYYVDKRERKFFDPYFEGIFSKIEDRFPNYEISISSQDKKENKLIVYLGGDTTRGKYYLYDVKAETFEDLGELAPWLDSEELATMKPIKYKSRDGLTIRGYLTLPKGYRKGTLPVVVNPHGGPWARDYWGFNPEIQFLANRGYAVLQMNFRGSTGFGRKFWEAGFKEWGKKMQDDITDGVKWLKDEGIARSNKVCIYGGSYGGYAVLAGLAFTPDLYACGVDYVGISNLFTFFKTIPPYWTPYLEMLYEMVGHPENDKALLKSASPFYHADQIKKPLFVAQGAKDPRVNISESDQIVAALKKRGIDVPYLVKENEGHGFHNEENRFEFYEKMETFLSEHL